MSDICVSVIIPIYNAKRHLAECLDSCLRQTLEQIEIICVNDGSTDGTEKLLEGYAEQTPKIKVLHQRNQGPGVARNLGIENAQGEFIAFMDSDDFYPDQDVLQKLYMAAVREHVSVCGGSALFMNDGKVDESDTGLVFQNNEIMHYREFQRTAKSTVFPQFIYSVRLLRENKILFPTWRWFEDPPFFVAAMTRADCFYVIRDLVYVLRNTDKVVQLYNDEIVKGFLNGIEAILKISKENQLETIHRAMQAQLTGDFAASIYERIYHGNAEIRKRYEEVVAKIDASLLGEDVPKIKALSDEEIAQIFDRSLTRERELLAKVDAHDKVLIYGAGRAGRFLYQYLRQRGYKAEIGFMISTEPAGYTACGKAIHPIWECTDEKDSALVIIANMRYIEQMKETAVHYQFKHVEAVSWHELMFFGADMKENDYLTIF